MEKSRVEQVVATMPDDVDLDSLVDKLYLLRKIEAGEAQIELGQVIPHEEVKRQIAEWLK